VRKGVIVNTRRWIGAGIAVALLAVASVLVVVTKSTTTPSPQNGPVPTGATVLTWTYPMPLPGHVATGKMTITNPTVIARVRSLINALPETNYPVGTICPADAMFPFTVSFATSPHAAPFATVVFQLGGCPTATVHVHGTQLRHTLGNWSLPTQYAVIQKVISPQGIPVA